MARYSVPLTGSASITVTIETDETDPETIARLALDEVTVSLCWRCGSSSNHSLDVGKEWETVKDHKTGKPEVYGEERGHSGLVVATFHTATKNTEK